MIIVPVFREQVLYEVLILAASYHVLRTGLALPWKYEVCFHVLIVTVGFAVTISFVAVTNGYSRNWLQITNDIEEKKYFKVEKKYMQIWIAPLAVCILLWTALHYSAHTIFREFHSEFKEAQNEWKAGTLHNLT